LSHLAEWFVHEFLTLWIRPNETSTWASLCRLIGCAVIAIVLHAELKDGLLPGVGAVIQLAVAGLTAILLGNVVKELAFDLYARLLMWSGRCFVREGRTPGGSRYCEIQFNDGTWLRCEMRSGAAIYEWTEPDGSCKRVALPPVTR
jgi:hypothetical protein